METLYLLLLLQFRKTGFCIFETPCSSDSSQGQKIYEDKTVKHLTLPTTIQGKGHQDNRSIALFYWTHFATQSLTPKFA